MNEWIHLRSVKLLTHRRLPCWQQRGFFVCHYCASFSVTVTQYKKDYDEKNIYGIFQQEKCRYVQCRALLSQLHHHIVFWCSLLWCYGCQFLLILCMIAVCWGMTAQQWTKLLRPCSLRQGCQIWQKSANWATFGSRWFPKIWLSCLATFLITGNHFGRLKAGFCWTLFRLTVAKPVDSL